MGRRRWSGLAGVAAGVAVVAAGAGEAAASSGIDSPESGVVQMGRGSAWVARAEDPLAVYFNPAAMAFQATSVHAGVQFLMSKQCFSRVGTNGQPVAPDTGIPAPLLPGQAPPGDGSIPPSDKVCTPGTPFPNPQVAAVFRVARNVALGVGVITPHASGANNWPESLSYTNQFGNQVTEPSPQRYLLVSSNALIVYPTFSVAYAPLDNLSFGAGFVWGVGSVDFVTFSEALSAKPLAGTMPTDHSVNDVRAEFKAKDLFIPGVVLSGLWMPTQNLDVAAWFKWQDALKADANATLTSLYWLPNSGVRNTNPCQGLAPNCNVTSGVTGTINFQIPMEAKLGLRFHLPRREPGPRPAWASNPDRKVRDPMSEDLFDIEVDFTYANNSAVQDLNIAFAPNQSIQGGSGPIGSVPTDASIPHHWKDVVGVRLGGDAVVLPSRLSLRAGAFYETNGQNDQYLSLDFDEAQKIGVSGGATVRLGPIDLSVGYQHTFYGTLTNNSTDPNSGIHALSGEGDHCPASMVAGPGCFRSYQPVNLGTLTAQLNEFGLSATARF